MPAAPASTADGDGYDRGTHDLDPVQHGTVLELTEAACTARSYEKPDHYYFESYSVWKQRGVLRDDDGTIWFYVAFHSYGCSSYGWGRSTDGDSLIFRGRGTATS